MNSSSSSSTSSCEVYSLLLGSVPLLLIFLFSSFKFVSIMLLLTSKYTALFLYAEATGISSPNQQSVVGVLSQPCSLGNRQDREYLNTFLIYFLSFATMDNFLHSLKNKLIYDGQHSKPWGISGVIVIQDCVPSTA